MLRQECKLTILMVGRLSLRSPLGTDRLLGYRLMRVKGYTYRRILEPMGYGPTTLPRATLVNIEHKGNMRMRVIMVAVSYFKYVHMRLFSYIMESYNSRNTNNKSEVMLCHELQNLNYLNNQVTSSNACILACRN